MIHGNIASTRKIAYAPLLETSHFDFPDKCTTPYYNLTTFYVRYYVIQFDFVSI